MSKIIKLKDYPILKAAIKRAVPSYKKHGAILFDHASVEIQGAFWDGGSRYGYLLCDFDGHHVESLNASTAPPQFGGSAPIKHVIGANRMVLKLGIFRGKTATVIITAPSFEVFGIANA